MKKNIVLYTFLSLNLLLFVAVGIASAQSNARGEIHGAIYEDVDGDGQCINTGIEGEEPVVGIPIEFVSSDEAVVITLETGSDGTFGLVAAGQSIWRVTAKPDSAVWTVTSENPLYPPVLPETGLIQTDVNFCISQGGSTTPGNGNAVIVLPESGTSATPTGFNGLIPILATFGILFIVIGLGLEFRRHQMKL